MTGRDLAEFHERERKLVMEETRFVLSDADGVFLTLSEREARAILDDLADDEDLTPGLLSMRTQLEEWISE